MRLRFLVALGLIVAGGLLGAPLRAQVPGINVKSAPYNAQGDGVTDDTVALQSAYTAAKAARMPLIIPPGNYRFTATLLWNDAIRIIGAGMRPNDPTYGTTLTKSGNFVGIKIQGDEAAYAVYSGFTLDSAGGDTSNGIEMDLEGASGLRLDHVRVRNQGGHGIFIRTGNMEIFESVIASGNGGDGIRVESFTGVVSASANVQIFSNVETTGNGGHGLNLARGDSHMISGLTTSGNAGYGVRLNNILSYLQVNSFSNTAGQILFDASSIRNYVVLMQTTGLTGIVNNGQNNLLLDLSTGRQHVPAAAATEPPAPFWITWPTANPKPFDPDRMTTAQRDALGNVQDGRIIFNTDLGVLNVRQFADWRSWPTAFDARLPLTGGQVTANGTTAGRNLNTAEPSDGILGGNNTPGAWWTWTSPCTFTTAGYTGFIDTTGSAINTIASVWSGTSLGSLTLLGAAQNPTGAPAGPNVQITAGTVLQFRVRGSGAAGAVRLRIRATGAGCSATFTDSTLTGGVLVKAVHITELRERVNNLRAAYGLGPFSWTDASLSGVQVKAVHISELRSALAAAYVAASVTPPSYTDPSLTAQATPVRATHITELRSAVVTLEGGS